MILAWELKWCCREAMAKDALEVLRGLVTTFFLLAFLGFEAMVLLSISYAVTLQFSVKCVYVYRRLNIMRVEDLIKSELSTVRFRNEQSGNIYIRCPYHSEKTPSFGINVDPASRKAPIGWGYCFGCGASKNWNQIAETLGLKKAKGMKKDGTFDQEYVAPMQKELRGQLLDGDVGLTLEDMEREWDCVLSYKIEKNQDWRGSTGKLLGRIGCYVSVDGHDNKCLLMPVIVDGVIVGAQKALWEKAKNKKVSSYLNYSGPWIKTQGLFPYDYAEKVIEKKGLNYVVLVEGARDALRLLALGVPALAILGTKNWSKQKRELVANLPIDTVVLMMDADEPGVAAREDIRADFNNVLTVVRIKLDSLQRKAEKKAGEKFKESWDPGNIPDKDLVRILKKAGLL